MAYLLDSDVLIDISRSRTASIDYVDTLPGPWAISQVTAMELLVWARDKREVAYLDAFLSSYPIVRLSESVGKRAYQLLLDYSKSHGLGASRRLLCPELGIMYKTVGRTPWSARVPLDPLFEQPNQSDATLERPTGESAADQGVRPTVCK
jgi:predicted nucleic acid-binding protein